MEKRQAEHRVNQRMERTNTITGDNTISDTGESVWGRRAAEEEGTREGRQVNHFVTCSTFHTRRFAWFTQAST